MLWFAGPATSPKRGDAAADAKQKKKKNRKERRQAETAAEGASRVPARDLGAEEQRRNGNAASALGAQGGAAAHSNVTEASRRLDEDGDAQPGKQNEKKKKERKKMRRASESDIDLNGGERAKKRKKKRYSEANAT